MSLVFFWRIFKKSWENQIILLIFANVLDSVQTGTQFAAAADGKDLARIYINIYKIVTTTILII